MALGRFQQFTASGAIAVGDVILTSIVLTPAAAAATVDIKEGGTGGPVVLSLQAPANGESVVIPGPVVIRDPFISAITAGAKLSVAK